MRLQHERSSALYRDPPRLATPVPIMFVFRNATKLLGLAGTATTGDAIGMGYGGNDESVEKQQSSGDCE